MATVDAKTQFLLIVRAVASIPPGGRGGGHAVVGGGEEKGQDGVAGRAVGVETVPAGPRRVRHADDRRETRVLREHHLRTGERKSESLFLSLLILRPFFRARTGRTFSP